MKTNQAHDTSHHIYVSSCAKKKNRLKVKKKGKKMTSDQYRMPLAQLPVHVLTQILCSVAHSEAQMGLIEALKTRGYETILGVLAKAPRFLAYVDTPTWVRMATDVPNYAPIERDVGEMRYTYRVHDLCDLVRLDGHTAPSARALLQRLRTFGGYADGSPHAALLDDGIAGNPRRYPAVQVRYPHVQDGYGYAFQRAVYEAVANGDELHGPIEVWDTRAVRSMRGTFYCLCELPALDLAFWDTSRATCMSEMFEDADVVTGLRDWNTRSVVDMRKMFRNCVWTPDVKNWVTSSVTDMSWTFSYSLRASDMWRYNANRISGRRRLRTPVPGTSACNPDVSKWDVSALTNANSMFAGAARFDGDVSRWDTRRLQSAESMFSGASSFRSDIARWNTRNVETMDSMFRNARAFTADISTWDTSKVRTMAGMFYNASAFTADISTWDTRLVAAAAEIFRGCPVSIAHMPRGLVGAIARRAEDERMVMALDFV